jgi:hypothetical protein
MFTINNLIKFCHHERGKNLPLSFSPPLRPAPQNVPRKKQTVLMKKKNICEFFYFIFSVDDPQER